MSMTFVSEEAELKYTCFFLMFETKEDMNHMINWIHDERLDINEIKNELRSVGVFIIPYDWELVNHFIKSQHMMYNKKYFLERSKNVEQVCLLPFKQNDLNEWQQTLIKLKNYLIEKKEMLSDTYSFNNQMLDHLDHLYFLKNRFKAIDNMYIYIHTEIIKGE